VIVQPSNRGTANGILLGVCAIYERNPEAIVTILPSDHYVEREEVLARVLEHAVASVGTSNTVAFLGFVPVDLNTERMRHCFSPLPVCLR
jgi:mannose-1-phosphate guanylyltransferase